MAPTFPTRLEVGKLVERSKLRKFDGDNFAEWWRDLKIAIANMGLRSMRTFMLIADGGSIDNDFAAALDVNAQLGERRWNIKFMERFLEQLMAITLEGPARTWWYSLENKPNCIYQLDRDNLFIHA